MDLPIELIDRYQMPAYDAIIAAFYQDKNLQRCRHIAERITFFSAQFLNKPYLWGALGEGRHGCFDQNPLYRTDAFDCVTFVSTVLALSLSNNLSEFKRNILKINYYDAQPKYHKRFHFMSVDWNPQNQNIGLVKDITTQICDNANKKIYETAKAKIDRPNWIKQRTVADIKLLHPISAQQAENVLAKIRQLAATLKCEHSALPYLPLTKLFNDKEPQHDIFQQIPHGAVIEIVRPNWNLRNKIGTNMNVSHMGFALRLNNELIFRQASLEKKRVIDVPLATYLRDICLPKPTIKGINVQSVLAG